MQERLIVRVQFLQAPHQAVNGRGFRCGVSVLLQVQVMDDLTDANDRRLPEIEAFRQRRRPYIASAVSSAGGFPRLGNDNGGLKIAEWSPKVDITEDNKEYIVKADLPELKKDDVKVAVENGVLSISGERKSEKEEKGKKFHRIERSYGSFERTFTMPEDADTAKMKADFKDGVLRVHVPKNPAGQPKKIDVKIE